MEWRAWILTVGYDLAMLSMKLLQLIMEQKIQDGIKLFSALFLLGWILSTLKYLMRLKKFQIPNSDLLKGYGTGESQFLFWFLFILRVDYLSWLLWPLLQQRILFLEAVRLAYTFIAHQTDAVNNGWHYWTFGLWQKFIYCTVLSVSKFFSCCVIFDSWLFYSWTNIFCMQWVVHYCWHYKLLQRHL